MIYWIITIQSIDDIRPVLLTTSFRKAQKEDERLEKEYEDDEYIYFYLNSIRLGQTRSKD